MEDNLKPLYFKVGDQVVTNRFEGTERIPWTSAREKHIGKVGTLTHTFPFPSVYGYEWPWSAIEHPNSLLTKTYEVTDEKVLADLLEPIPDLYVKRIRERGQPALDAAKVECMVEKYKANPCASPEVWIALEPMNEAEKQAFLNAIATLPESKYTWLKLTQDELSDLVHALDYTRDNYTGVWGENKRKRHFELQAMINKYISP